MILGNSILGGNTCLTTAIPPSSSYDKIQFLGESVLDAIQALNIEADTTEIKYIKTAPIWDINTIFLSNFEDTLESGNIQNADKPIGKWHIKRKKDGDQLYTILLEKEFDKSNASYIDKTPNNKIKYDYAVYPVAEDGTEGSPTEGVKFVSFYGWILSDDTTTYTFDIEIVTDPVQTVDDVKEYENFTQFNVVSFGNRQFDRGSLKTIPMTINGSALEQTADYLNILKAFINNKQPKLLKNSKGKSWQVITRNYSEQYMDKLSEQIVTISFDWQQIGAGAS